jgi:alpha-amylase/alpha-mannosidase (GH57 family)
MIYLLAGPLITIMSTGTLRVVLLWHMHQPFYKDLVTGEYRLPWVRMHALKDYYGMVKLLDEFPNVHQNFNLVPSLVSQIQEYASANFRDPFFDVVAKPAVELTPEARRFALQYLFQAHTERMIGRYPRYRSLYEKVHAAGPDPTRAESMFTVRDYADLQVLSQVAWFDEFFQDDPEVRALVEKKEGFSPEDQKVMLRKQHQIINAVIPAYAVAAKRGQVELSTTPYYHPILPLICDTNAGADSTSGLPLPRTRFRHPDDANEQIRRAIDSHELTFGVKPKGMWPSEGSVSDEAIAIADANGIEWMATDEGVLGRSIDFSFDRDSNGTLGHGGAERLYNIYKYENEDAEMKIVFRDHRLSDLIGFVYSGMPARDASAHLIASLKSQAAPVLESGRDAVVSIILDGENAWENYELSGREFLRRFYSHLQSDPQIEAVTISEAIERHKPTAFGTLKQLTPGSWINANFNVWIGAQEDNKAWDYLAEARAFYDANAAKARPEKQKLAMEELLIAEGSDWNWWYGPEHHSANDRDFDELFRKHLSNVYAALGAVPPEHLARPIAGGVTKPTLVPQTAYVHPEINGKATSYFAWMGAAMYSSDRRTGSMHGKEFILESIHAGIDEEKLYGRLDFAAAMQGDDWEAVVFFAVGSNGDAPKTYRLEAQVREGVLHNWELVPDAQQSEVASSLEPNGAVVAVSRVFEFGVPLSLLNLKPGMNVSLRFVVYRDQLPIDALPLEGSLDVQVRAEDELALNAYLPS